MTSWTISVFFDDYFSKFIFDSKPNPTIMEIHINYLAILVTVIANFILGFLWYTPLFGKAWARELGFDTSVKPPAGALAKGMIFMVIGNFLLAYVFAHNIAAWSFVPEMKDSPAANTIFSSAVFTWLGFFLPVDLSSVAWENRSWKLFFINTGYHLMTLIVAATILTLWK
jgi:hypothetical protein